MNGTLVISDIDGTLIDHPHLASSSFDRKVRDCRRLVSLLKKHRICLCSGRQRHHYENFQKQYAGECVFPWFLVAECGGEVIQEGFSLLSKPQDPFLAALEKSLRCWASGRGLPIDDDESECRVQGVCFELKRQCLDVEWDMDNPILDEAVGRDFVSYLSDVIDPVKLQYLAYPLIRRINICPSGFRPKGSIWPEISSLLGTPRAIWVVGDEQMDVEMAEAVKLCWPQSEVLFASTNPRIGGAVQLSCGVEAVEFIEWVLGSNSG
jgi:hypothetical protein